MLPTKMPLNQIVSHCLIECDWCNRTECFYTRSDNKTWGGGGISASIIKHKEIQEIVLIMHLFTCQLQGACFIQITCSPPSKNSVLTCDLK